MDRTELVEKYFNAWNRRDSEALLSLFHPQASYLDAFWGESCAGLNFRRFIETELETEERWYRLEPPIIPTRAGMIARYTAFDASDTAGISPLFSGAEIIVVSDGLIRTITDHYCDNSVVNLLEVADGHDANRTRFDVIVGGLGSRESSRIKRRLKELASSTGIYLDPSLTATRLSDHVGCSVMHLFYVLEREMQTTFPDFVDECRCRYASWLLVDDPGEEKQVDEIAEDCGFVSVHEFRKAFEATFGIEPGEYRAQFDR